MLQLPHRLRRAGLPLLGLLGLAACSGPPDASWQLISPRGFPLTNHAAQALLFLDDSTGLLLGGAWSEAAALGNTITEEQVSTIFRTTDGGRSWRMQARSKGRRFVLATRLGPAAYAVELQPRSARSPRDTSALLRSTDGGQTWQPLGRLPGRVFTLSFADTAQGLALTTTPLLVGTAIYRTTDGGRSWQPGRLPAAAPALSGVAAPDGTAWLLLPPPGPHPSFAATLARVDWRTGAVAAEAIPGGHVEAPPLLDEAGDLWLAGSAPDGSVQLLRRAARSGRYTEVHRFAPASGERLRPVALHRAGTSFSLLARDTQTGQARFYHSADAGRSWQEETLSAAAVFDLCAFAGLGRAWLSIPGPRLLVRGPRP